MAKFKVTYMRKVEEVIETADIERAAAIARNEAAKFQAGVCRVFAIEELRADQELKPWA